MQYDEIKHFQFFSQKTREKNDNRTKSLNVKNITPAQKSVNSDIVIAHNNTSNNHNSDGVISNVTAVRNVTDEIMSGNGLLNRMGDISKSQNNLHVIPHNCETGIPVRGATCVKFLEVPNQDYQRPLSPISPGKIKIT